MAAELGVSAVSVPQIKPLSAAAVPLLAPFKKLIFLEEHSRYGGLYSTFCEAFCDQATPGRPAHPPLMSSLSLADRFAHDCGSYQFALSEHELSDTQVRERLRALCL
jgi:transketolase C-terminal domain/subunit